MKGLFVLILVYCFNSVQAQYADLEDAVKKLDRALVRKDTSVLHKLLDKDLSFGHSNGWVQSKQEVISDLRNKKLGYDKIRSSDQRFVIKASWATVYYNAEVKYVLDGKKGDLNLHVMQVWIRSEDGWRLVARQSTKI